MKRFDIIFSLIESAETFADVGCDHGFIADRVLENNLAKTVYITDISKPSLDKAIALLTANGRQNFIAVCTDGLTDLPFISEVLIAGMGGEEIIKILKKSAYKPDIVILQPMKNVEKVRKCLHDDGYGLLRDFMFYDGDKYYEILKAVKNYDDGYTPTEELYGRDNLKNNPDFIRYLDFKISETESIIGGGGLKSDSLDCLTNRLLTYKGLKNEIERN